MFIPRQLATSFLTLTGDGVDVIRSSRAEESFITQFMDISAHYFSSCSSVRIINRWMLLRFRMIAAVMQFLIVLGVILIRCASCSISVFGFSFARAYYPAFLTLSQIGVAFSYSIVFVEKIADLEILTILAHCDEVWYCWPHYLTPSLIMCIAVVKCFTRRLLRVAKCSTLGSAVRMSFGHDPATWSSRMSISDTKPYELR